MGFLVGKTNTVSNVNTGTSKLDQGLTDWLSRGGFGAAMPGTAIDPTGLEAFKTAFADQNAQTFGQAKESAGNLTGSGLGNSLGTAAAGAANSQNAFLANFLEQRRQNDANRFVNLLLGTLGSPAAGVHQTYTPGLLDYAGQAATGLASGGAFNGLFGGGGGPSKSSVANTGGINPTFPESGGQPGQASRYFFNGTHVPPDVYGNPYSGWGSGRDTFGTGRDYLP